MQSDSTISPDQKTAVMRSLLINFAITSEFCSRVGMPPEQLQAVVIETVRNLDLIFSRCSAVSVAVEQEIIRTPVAFSAASALDEYEHYR